MNETKEIAKATQEGFKFGTRALETSEKLGAFLAQTLGEPIDTTTGMLGDWLKFHRWSNAMAFMERATKRTYELGLSTDARPVPPKLALPIFENASLEENAFLQNMWVNLLTTALDSEKEIPRTTFIDILKMMTPMDAKILKHLYDEYAPRRYLVEDPTYFPAIGEIGDPPEEPKMIEGYTSPCTVNPSPD